MQTIDIMMVTWNRKDFTEKSLIHLHNRTKTPFRLFVVDNASEDGTDDILNRYYRKGIIYKWVRINENIGIHMAKNIGKAMVDSKFYVDTDNDILVPDLEPDWLEQLVRLMRNNPEYAAIALQPHIFIGAKQIPVDYKEDIIERNMAGAVMRLMNKRVVEKAGGWERDYNRLRNNEERHICSRLQGLGYKVGYTGKMRAFHLFGDSLNTDPWGYDKKMKPEEHGHRKIWPVVSAYGDMSKYDEKTWYPK